jgi:hypothetical protein
MDDASGHNLKHLIDLTEQYLSQTDTQDNLAKLGALLTS